MPEKMSGPLDPVLKKTFQWAALIFLAWGIFQITLGERLPDNLNSGLGWDGGIYGCWAKDFWQGIRKIFVPSDYHAQRIFPSFLVYHTLRVFMPQVDITDWTVIKAFQVFNLGLTLLCIYLWYRICVRLKASAERFCFGMIAFAFNFAILKFQFFYPVLTDSFGLAIGMLMVYAVLIRSLPLVFAATLMGAFSWPTVYSGGLLILLLWGLESRSEPSAQRIPKQVAQGVAGFMALLVGALSIRLFYAAKADPTIYFEHGYGRFSTVLSTIFFVVFVFGCVLSFLNAIRLPSVRSLRGTKVALRIFKPVALAIFAMFFVKFLVGRVSNGTKFEMLWLVNTAIARSIAYPAVFLIGHIVYFGPAMFLAIWKWPAILRVFQRDFGLAGAVLMFGFLPWVISSESRAIINYFPLVVVALSLAIDEEFLSRRNLLIFGALSLFASKIWFPLNHRMFERYTPFEVTIPNFQRYFMNFGSFFTNRTYAVNLAVSLVFVTITWMIFRNKKTVVEI